MRHSLSHSPWPGSWTERTRRSRSEVGNRSKETGYRTSTLRASGKSPELFPEGSTHFWRASCPQMSELDNSIPLITDAKRSSCKSHHWCSIYVKTAQKPNNLNSRLTDAWKTHYSSLPNIQYERFARNFSVHTHSSWQSFSQFHLKREVHYLGPDLETWQTCDSVSLLG